jgi:hypothetical protein
MSLRWTSLQDGEDLTIHLGQAPISQKTALLVVSEL